MGKDLIETKIKLQKQKMITKMCINKIYNKMKGIITII